MIPCHRGTAMKLKLDVRSVETQATQEPQDDHDAPSEPSSEDSDGDGEGRPHRTQYSGASLITWLELSQLVRAGVDLRHLLSLAVQVLCDAKEDAAVRNKLSQKTNSPEFRVPSERTLRRASVRLDLAKLWHERRQWAAGSWKVSGLSFDASEQLNHMCLCFLEDSFEIPSSMPSSEALRLDLHQRSSRAMRPITCLGLGETDLAHKISALYHQGRTCTPDRASFDRWRWSVVGGVSDQGTERLMFDCPNLDSPTEIHAAAAQLAAKLVPTEARNPDTFLLPRAIAVRGPYHILWNAYERCVTKTDAWETFKSRLSAILHFLGWPPSRRRFAETCLHSDKEKEEFGAWPHKVIDFKWEYMENRLADVDRVCLLFLERFNLQRYQAGIDADADIGEQASEAEREAAIASKKSLNVIAQLQENPFDFAVEVCMHATFSHAVGTQCRWFTGCPCHDWLWLDSTFSDSRKEMKLQQLIGSKTCAWRGRRASELARGRCDIIVRNVRHALNNSDAFQQLMSQAAPESRARALHGFQLMADMWCEEVAHKFSYWRKLPRLLCGIYPRDAVSQSICQQAVEQYDAAVASGSRHTLHRVSLRFLDVHGLGTGCLPALIRLAATTGEVHDDLLRESLEYNCVPTLEQPVEGLHARLAKASHTREFNPVQASALLCQKNNLELFRSFGMRLFANHVFRSRKVMVRGLADVAALGREFVLHADLREVLLSIYHCHSRQLFRRDALEKYLVKSWSCLQRPVLPDLVHAVRVLVAYVKTGWPQASSSRFRTHFSMPQLVVPRLSTLARMQLSQQHGRVVPPRPMASTSRLVQSIKTVPSTK